MREIAYRIGLRQATFKHLAGYHEPPTNVRYL